MAEALVLRGVSPNTLNADVISSKDEKKRGGKTSKTRSYKNVEKESTGKDSEAGLERKKLKMPVLTPQQNLTPFGPKPNVTVSASLASKPVSSAVRDEPGGDTLNKILAAIQSMQTKQDEQDEKIKQMQFYDWSQDGGEAPIIDLGLLDQLGDPTGEPMDFSEQNFDQVNQDDDQLDLLETELSCGQVQNSPFTGLSQVSSKRESIQPKISSSLFDMAKKYQKSEEVSHAMNEGLAESINSIFREGLSEDSLGTLLKAKEATRPKNCPALCTPRVNDLMCGEFCLHLLRVVTNSSKTCKHS